ncbi:hypothetical protein BsWGS_16737 [Bradybaena similaris]
MYYSTLISTNQIL